MKLRAFIIEDEPPARQRLRELLADEPDVECIGESDGSPETLATLRREQPDVIFLDLHIPRSDGFALLRQARLNPLPAIVVVTAYADHAVEAFEQQVTDYLLKPCRPLRLHTALERARHHLATRGRTGAAAHQPAEDASGSGRLVRFVIRNEQQLDVVRVDQVDWLAAAGNYVVLHSGRQTHVLRESLSALETRLDPACFVRISRAALVNLDRIRTVSTAPDGSASVALGDGTQLPLTRGIRELQARLELG